MKLSGGGRMVFLLTAFKLVRKRYLEEEVLKKSGGGGVPGVEGAPRLGIE